MTSFNPNVGPSQEVSHGKETPISKKSQTVGKQRGRKVKEKTGEEKKSLHRSLTEKNLAPPAEGQKKLSRSLSLKFGKNKEQELGKATLFGTKPSTYTTQKTYSAQEANDLLKQVDKFLSQKKEVELRNNELIPVDSASSGKAKDAIHLILQLTRDLLSSRDYQQLESKANADGILDKLLNQPWSNNLIQSDKNLKNEIIQSKILSLAKISLTAAEGNGEILQKLKEPLNKIINRLSQDADVTVNFEDKNVNVNYLFDIKPKESPDPSERFYSPSYPAFIQYLTETSNIFIEDPESFLSQNEIFSASGKNINKIQRKMQELKVENEIITAIGNLEKRDVIKEILDQKDENFLEELKMRLGDSPESRAIFELLHRLQQIEEESYKFGPSREFMESLDPSVNIHDSPALNQIQEIINKASRNLAELDMKVEEQRTASHKIREEAVSRIFEIIEGEVASGTITLKNILPNLPNRLKNYLSHFRYDEVFNRIDNLQKLISDPKIKNPSKENVKEIRKLEKSLKESQEKLNQLEQPNQTIIEEVRNLKFDGLRTFWTVNILGSFGSTFGIEMPSVLVALAKKYIREVLPEEIRERELQNLKEVNSENIREVVSYINHLAEL